MWVVSSQARAELIDPENKEILVKAEFKFHTHLESFVLELISRWDQRSRHPQG